MELPPSALVPSQRLRVAYLLTLVGGYLDAYTYFERGGAFANAQTGNIVKLGIALANGPRESYLFYTVPIVAFALGILASLHIEAQLSRRNVRLVRRSILVIEMVGLCLVALIPSGEEWNMLANSIVSFVAAMQFETFSTFRGAAIATTMSTGNLRKFVDNLYAGATQGDIDRMNDAATYFTIIVTFALGAFFGAHVCNVMDQAAVLPAVACLGIAVGIITVLRRQNLARS